MCILITWYVVLNVVFNDSHVNTRAKRYQNVLSIRTEIQYIPKVYLSRTFLILPRTIDQLIDWCSYSRVTKLSFNWNCPDKWSRRLLIGIVLKIVLTGCLLIGTARTIDIGWCAWIEIVGAIAFGDRAIIEIIRTIEFERALLFENRQLLLCKVPLIDLFSTLQYHATIGSLTGWRSSLYTQPFARYRCILL